MYGIVSKYCAVHGVGCLVCVIGFKSIMSYMEWVVWYMAIQIMMRTARKRGLILAVGEGIDVAAK